MLSKVKAMVPVRFFDNAYVSALQYKLQMFALALLCAVGAVRAVLGLAALMGPGLEGFLLSPAPRENGQHFLSVGISLFLITVFTPLASGFWIASQERRPKAAAV